MVRSFVRSLVDGRWLFGWLGLVGWLVSCLVWVWLVGWLGLVGRWVGMFGLVGWLVLSFVSGWVLVIW